MIHNTAMNVLHTIYCNLVQNINSLTFHNSILMVTYVFAELQEIAGGTCAGTQPRSTSCDLIPLEVHSSQQTQSVETDHFGFGTSIKASDFDIVINRVLMLLHKMYKYGLVNNFIFTEWQYMY